MSKPLRILGIAGSLRRQSYNRGLLRAATQTAPEGTTIDIFEIDGIPPFSEDVEQNQPAEVVEMKRRIREADADLFSAGRRISVRGRRLQYRRTHERMSVTGLSGGYRL
ncbi:MAG: NAD(P)H-dependent oxidoreductase [Acidobacteria bacterium]|nr:NAD(P)H-dependent oxidoreductase [Acidobacteriota bacterium]